MLGKDHVLFFKNIFFSRLSVCSSYNSESDPKNLQFLTITRLFNVITSNNNVTA